MSFSGFGDDRRINQGRESMTARREVDHDEVLTLFAKVPTISISARGGQRGDSFEVLQSASNTVKRKKRKRPRYAGGNKKRNEGLTEGNAPVSEKKR